MRKPILILFMLCFVRASFAANAKILLPVTRVFGGLPGAYGSLWDVEITAYNRATTPVAVLFNGAAPVCPAPPCVFPAPVTYGPQSTAPLTAWSSVQRVVGGFATLEASQVEDLVIQTRVFDTSREATNWGAYVPSVPETAAEVGVVDFPSVITAAPFRATLRIYDFDPDSTHAARVRVFRTNWSGDQLIQERVVTLQATLDPTLFPGEADVDLSSIAPDEPSVRVAITPMTPGLRYWAMVSVTNNITQYLTILTPPRHGAVDQATLAGARVSLAAASVYRNFMPGANSGLQFRVDLRTDQQSFPTGLVADAAWIESKYGTWQPVLNFVGYVSDTDHTSRAAFAVLGGPGWPVGGVVDVAVRLKAADGSTALLTIRNLQIQRVE